MLILIPRQPAEYGAHGSLAAAATITRKHGKQTLSLTALALQLTRQPAGIGQTIVEDPADKIAQLANAWVTHCVSHR
jgi:hypothetical protein